MRAGEQTTAPRSDYKREDAILSPEPDSQTEGVDS